MTGNDLVKFIEKSNAGDLEVIVFADNGLLTTAANIGIAEAPDEHENKIVII